jgi:hypothetical protein
VEELFGPALADDVIARYLEVLPAASASSSSIDLDGRGSSNNNSASTSFGGGDAAAAVLGRRQVRYQLRAPFDTEEKIHTRIKVGEDWPKDLKEVSEVGREENTTQI